MKLANRTRSRSTDARQPPEVSCIDGQARVGQAGEALKFCDESPHVFGGEICAAVVLFEIGDVDLDCHLGSPGSVIAFVQRFGRAGEAFGAIHMGLLFPLSLDDVLEWTSLLDAVQRGVLDRIVPPEHPLDAIAMQILA